MCSVFFTNRCVCVWLDSGATKSWENVKGGRRNRTVKIQVNVCVVWAQSEESFIFAKGSIAEGFKEEVASGLGLEEWGGVVTDLREGISKTEVVVGEEAEREVEWLREDLQPVAEFIHLSNAYWALTVWQASSGSQGWSRECSRQQWVSLGSLLWLGAQYLEGHRNRCKQ